MNLSSTELPSDSADVLSLGDNFNLDSDERNVFEFLKDLEYSVYRYRRISVEVREDVLHVVDSHIKNKPRIKLEDRILNTKIKKTKECVKSHDNLFLTRADKCNSTVATKLWKRLVTQSTTYG